MILDNRMQIQVSDMNSMIYSVLPFLLTFAHAIPAYWMITLTKKRRTNTLP